MSVEGDDVCLWPDGTWCFFWDVEQHAFMSDDYEIVKQNDPRYEKLVQE